MNLSELNSANREAAVALAREGLRVIPCRDNKHPLLPDWPNAGSSNLETISRWWQQFQNAVPGLPCGANGLLVVDCDRKNGIDGVTAWNDLCALNQFDQGSCFIVQTPSGGRHIYFRQHAPLVACNTVSKLAPGIDIRGDGGQVIAPGAVLSDGRGYVPVNGSLATTAWLPDGLRQQLQQLSRVRQQQQLGEPTQPTTQRERTYASKTLEAICDELAALQSGMHRNDALNKAAHRMGTMVGASWIARGQVEAALFAASERNGYVAKDGKHATLSTIASGIDAGARIPHCPLTPNELQAEIRKFLGNGFPQRELAAASNGSGERQLIARRVSDVAPEPIQWLWRNRIASGKLSIIAGDPGLGKSQLTAFMAAKVTTGTAWPNGEGVPCAGSVVMLSCEDDIADTIRPRLEAAGADLQRVHVLDVVHSGTGATRALSITADLAAIECRLAEIPDARLVVIDPITAYLDKTDTHKTADVRAALAPLQSLAARRRIAVVAISHLNKSGGNGKSINAITGSGAFVAASRATFLVAQSQDDAEQRLFVQAKNNLGNAPGLAFRIKEAALHSGIVAPYVEFENCTISISADDAIGPCHEASDHSQLDAAKQLLREELRSGPVLATILFDRAKEQRISEKTLRRAKDALAVRARKEEQYQGRWVWEFPFSIAPFEVIAPTMASNDKDGRHNSATTFAQPWPPLAEKAGEG